MQFRAIQSDANEKFKRWKKLTESARAIKKEGVTLAEGAHLAITLFEKGIKPRALIFRASGVTDELSEIVQVWAAEKIPCYVLDNKLYDQISPVEHGAGMICEIRCAVFRRRSGARQCRNVDQDGCGSRHQLYSGQSRQRFTLVT